MRPTLSGRFRIRQAAIEDLPDLAAMKARAWRQSYDLPESALIRQDAVAAAAGAQWQAEAAAGAYFWAVLDTEADPPALVGVARAGAARDADAPRPLELFMLYLLDVAKGSGIADRLLEMAIGDAPAYLWVLADNARAIAFYRRHGFAPDGESQQLSGELAQVSELRMVRPAPAAAQ